MNRLAESIGIASNLVFNLNWYLAPGSSPG